MKEHNRTTTEQKDDDAAAYTLSESESADSLDSLSESDPLDSLSESDPLDSLGWKLMRYTGSTCAGSNTTTCCCEGEFVTWCESYFRLRWRPSCRSPSFMPTLFPGDKVYCDTDTKAA